MARTHRATARAALLGLLLTPIAALAWNNGADFETSIHGHDFSRVTFESDRCQVKVRLLFAAPATGYKNETVARNFYRFHARIKLDDGRQVLTRVFSNSAPGLRAYAYTLDTKPEGCWAKDERKIQGIDIEGCRGIGCKPEPFE
jgi:hypothetical protein